MFVYLFVEFLINIYAEKTYKFNYATIYLHALKI